MTAVGFRALLALARIEATLLARNIFTVAGVVIGWVVVRFFVHGSLPVWWAADWQIGYGQIVVSLAVLIAAQLAASRARRDEMDELYSSLPVSMRARTAGHLFGQVGAVVPCAVLIGACSGYLWSLHVVGQPSAWVLIAGVLLVVAAGTIGVAVGGWFSHPFAGIVAAFIWFLPFSQANRLNGSVVWVFPWEIPYQLRELPGRLRSYPPGAAHTLELAGIVLLAIAVALAAGKRASSRVWLALATTAALAIAAVATADVAQRRAIPRAQLSYAVTQVTQPASQRCSTVSAGPNTAQVCTFAAFAPLAAPLETVVHDVLALAPSRHQPTLLIAQTSGLTLDDSVLTHGQPPNLIASWARELATAPATQPSTTAVYVNLTSWPTGSKQARTRYLVALGAANWAVGLPTSAGTPQQAMPCAPLNQAREAIAIWLANQATHTRPHSTSISPANGFLLTQVDAQPTVVWIAPGSDQNYLSAPGTQLTAAGYLLAEAMAQLPAAHVNDVISRQWSRWVDPHTTDTDLAAALGITMPTVPTNIVTAIGRHLAGPVQQLPACV